MHRAERTRRLARLLRVLSKNKSGVTIAQIVAATETSRATAYRDLELLRQSGYDLNTRTIAGEARYTVLGSELSTQPMNPRQRAALMLARRTLSAIEGTWPVRELDALLKQRLDASVADSGILMKLGLVSYDPTILQVMHDAVTAQRMLRIRYRGSEDEQARDRTVHPWRIQVADQHPYLLAWDQEKGGLRTFKAARVRQARMLRSKCRLPSSLQPEEPGEAESVKIWRSEVQQVRIRIASHVARFVREWPLVPGQQLENLRDGSVIVSANVFGLKETLRWALRWGRNAEVLEPVELREMISSELAAALSFYQQRGSKAQPRRQSPA